MRKAVVVSILILVGVAAGAMYHFTLKGNVEVNETELAVSPQSFSVEVRKGATYVKSVTIKNYGEAREIYFEYVVEGPDPESVEVFVNDVYGNRVSSSNKLSVPAGSQNSPSEVEVNVHVEVDEDAQSGEYVIYIMAKET